MQKMFPDIRIQIQPAGFAERVAARPTAYGRKIIPVFIADHTNISTIAFGRESIRLFQRPSFHEAANPRINQNKNYGESL